MKMKHECAEKAARTVRVRRNESGFSAEGPGFYVWDESLSAVLEAAGELRRGRFPAAPVRRALLVRSFASGAPSLDPEALDR
jgi:hypothetical protein